MKYLAKRLLNETALSDESEKQLIIELKQECGQLAVNKIEKMLEDIE